MANENNTILDLHNYFYGTENHYYHPGWYFDKIVDKKEEIQNKENGLDKIRPGRYVLCQEDNAIFVRTGDTDSDNYYFVSPKIYNDRNYYYYNDFEHISGRKVGTVKQSILDNYNQAGIDVIVTSGYRFISYTNNMASILLENNAVLTIPTSNAKPVLFSVAPADQLGNLASYYFGI